MKKLSLMILLVCNCFCNTVAHAVEIKKWQRLPISIPLFVNQERVIFVDRPIQVGMPSSVQAKLRLQVAQDTLYLKAMEPIPPTRLQLRDEQGNLILIDIAAYPHSGEPALEPIRIIEGENPNMHYVKPEKTAHATDSSEHHLTPKKIETPIPIVLTRYAAQNLYAPLRTVEPVPGIGQVNVAKQLALNTLLPLLPIKANAIAAWQLENYVVTAIKLQNTSQTTIILDPRILQGDFISATFQHNHLEPYGQSTDTTVLYLVTFGHGLKESLLPTISPIDATITLRSINER